MANEATVATGKTESVEELPDIGAEQASLAASLAADPTVDPTATKPSAEVVAKSATELTPAGKQAAMADDHGEISIDMFKQGTKTPVIKPATQDKTVAAKADTSATPVKTVEATAQEQAQHATRVSVLPPEYQELGKKMSNDAIAKFAELINERKTLSEQLAEAKKGALPDNYTEHEQAYVLTPEFAQASDAVTSAEQVLQHWSAQADALAGGADEYSPLQQGQDGKMYIGAPVKADRTTLNQVGRAVNWAQNQYMQAQGALQAVGATHKVRAAETKQWVQNFERTAFKVFDDKPELKAMVGDTKAKMLHKSLHSNILADAFAKAVIIMDYQAKALQAQQAGGANSATTQATTKTNGGAQPSAAAIAGGGATPTGAGAKPEVTFDDFQRAKKGLL